MLNTPATDTLIIGAGPAGLYAAFSLGLQGLNAHIIDALPHVGGQCAQLFAHKVIYDIPAIQSCTGAQLSELLLKQAQVFQPQLSLNTTVTRCTFDLHAQCFNVTLDNETMLCTRTVLIASGTGAFLPKKIPLDGASLLEEKHLFYKPAQQVVSSGKITFDKKNIIICGDLETTLETANYLATQTNAASVTLIHRRDKFRANENLVNTTKKLREKNNINFIAAQLTQLHTDQNKALTHITIQQSTNQAQITIPADLLFILQGLSPKNNYFTEWGLQTQGKLLTVNPSNFQTNLSGIFAVGDAITYPGKRQLIVSAFHEATLAAYGIASYLQGNSPIPQLYTTSSSKLQKILNKN